MFCNIVAQNVFLDFFRRVFDHRNSNFDEGGNIEGDFDYLRKNTWEICGSSPNIMILCTNVLGTYQSPEKLGGHGWTDAAPPACCFQVFWKFNYSKDTRSSIDICSGHTTPFYVEFMNIAFCTFLQQVQVLQSGYPIKLI